MNLAECYRLLGLRTGASFSDIKASYRRLARIYHPDVNPGDQDLAREKFIQLTDAYQTLISLVRRTGLPGGQPSNSRTSGGVSSYTQAGRSPIVDIFTEQPAARKPTSVPASNPPQPPLPTKPPKAVHLSVVDQRLKQSSYESLQQLLKERRYPRAIALVEGLAQRIPTDPEIRQWQAITYKRWSQHLIDRREFAKAQLYLRKALRTDPNNRSLGLEIARELHRLEQLAVRQ